MRDGKSVFALGPETRVTISLVVAIFGAVYWVIVLGSRVAAAETKLAELDQSQADMTLEVIKRLDAQAQVINQVRVDVAGIDASLSFLIDLQKRPNPRR